MTIYPPLVQATLDWVRAAAEPGQRELVFDTMNGTYFATMQARPLTQACFAAPRAMR